MPSNTSHQNPTESAIWRGTDINYPGVPVPGDPPPPPVIKTSTHARGLDIDAYVFRYTARQRLHVLMIAAGAALIVAAIYWNGLAQALAIVAAVALILSGSASLLIMANAWATYTRLSITTTHTHADPRPTPVADVRPAMTVADNIIRRGRFQMPADMWGRLFDAAQANDGRLTRDNIVQARGLPRHLYHGDAWQRTLDELRRLGIIDAENRITPQGWAFNDTLAAPLPHDPSPPRSPARTNANERTARTAANWGQS